MKRALVVFAHPVPESFSAALHARTVAGLKTAGWEVDDLDLNAEGFSPVLTCEERRVYNDEGANINGSVAPYVERVKAAQALVLVFPVWNFGYPAILKGFFDRVFLPGVTLRIEGGRVQPNLQNIKKLAAVTTYGGTRLRAFLAGDPPRKVVTRPLRFVMARDCTTKYLALYDMNNADAAKRGAFLTRVGREMDAF